MSQGLYYTLIVIGALVVWGSLVALALRGWRNRGRRQEDTVGAFPTPPADADALGATLVPTTTGLYVGSTIAPSWQNRVAVGDYGDRAVTQMTAYDAGILLERTGANPIWIPADSIVAVRTENGLAGKVMSRDGVLVIRWTLPSGVQIDSGLRGDDKKAYPQWTAAYADQTERAFAEQEARDALAERPDRKSGTTKKKED